MPDATNVKMKRIFEERKNKLLKKELKEAHAEIGNMDQTIKFSWEQLKEAN